MGWIASSNSFFLLYSEFRLLNSARVVLDSRILNSVFSFKAKLVQGYSMIQAVGVQGEVDFAMTDHLHISLPRQWIEMSDEQRSESCEQLVSFGCNAVIFLCSSAGTIRKGDLQPFLSCFKCHGIRVILQPSMHVPFPKSPANPDYRTLIGISLRELQRQSGSIDGLFWQSGLHQEDYFEHIDARDALQLDLALIELAAVEKALEGKVPLIYYVPSVEGDVATRETQRLERLSEAAGKGTTLAFSAVAGEPTADHLPSHPIWDVLRYQKEPMGTPLLPIVNTGGVNQGEGIWPSLAYEIFDLYMNPVHRPHFAGVVNLSRQVPTGKGMLACNLSVGGQIFQRNVASEWLIEEWFRKNRPASSYPKLRASLRQIRHLALELSQLKTAVGRSEKSAEECRVVVDSLLMQIKQLHHSMAKTEFADHFAHFMRDARVVIKQFAQRNNVGSSHLWAGDEG